MAAALGAAAVITSSGPVAAAAGVAAVVTAALNWLPPSRRHAHGDAPAAEPDLVETAAPPSGAPTPPVDVDTSGSIAEAPFAAILRGRLAVARRALRPLSLVYFEVDDVPGLPATEVEVGVRATLRESDVTGRRSDGTHALVLDDTSEDGAVWTSERLRRALCADRPGRRFWAGVASYPTHGLDAAALEAKASAALETARSWQVDRIEVADGS